MNFGGEFYYLEVGVTKPVVFSDICLGVTNLGSFEVLIDIFKP